MTQAAGAPRRIAALVVDDERDTLELVTRVLRPQFEVTVAQSGEEALALIAENDYACVISDQRMPGAVQGSTVLEHAAHRSPQSVRVLMTAYADSAAIVDAINLGHTSAFLKKPFVAEELEATLGRALDFHSLSVRYSHAMRELEQRTLELQARTRELEEQKRLLAMTVDERTAELTRAVEKLQGMVFRDALTGLHNHRYFQERLTQETERATRHALELSLLFVDIDHFKHYNDKHGHPAGDEALKRVGGLLARLRASDIAARYGGEEFVVILPETSADSACVVAERLRAAVERIDLPGVAEQPGGRLTISLGLATFPGHARSKEDLILRADQALFQAKRAGRNRLVVYEPGAPGVAA